MTVVIWHNPRCSKSRETLALVQAQGVTPQVRLYLKDPPGRDEITAALQALNLSAGEVIRRKELAYAQAGLTADSSQEEMIAAMVQFPVLIERPIVFAGGKAAIGRPPAAVLALL